jgi:hypothetical protein
MCLRTADAGTLSRLLLISILKGNPELCRIHLGDETPDFALEDLNLASWGGDGMHDPEGEGHAPAR